MIGLAKYTVILFGFFLIGVGFLMIFKPEKTKEIITKAGSTYLINYTELGIRLLIGIAFVLSSELANYKLQFKVIGYFLIVSALVLMCLPIKLHNKFSRKEANQLKPIYLKIVGPISIFFGIILIIAFNK